MDVAGLLAVAAALALATVVGLVLRARSGRVRAAGASAAPVRAARPGTGGWGPREVTKSGGWALAGRTPVGNERVLLLQLSSQACAPCRQAAAVLDTLAADTAGLVHVDVDIADRPDVARALRVLRTPTTVAFDRAGTELLRVWGVPRVTELASALAPALVS